MGRTAHSFPKHGIGKVSTWGGEHLTAPWQLSEDTVSDSMRRVGVVGAGTMGGGIAQVCIQAGVETVLVDIELEFCEAAAMRIGEALDRSVAKGNLTEGDRDAQLARLHLTADLNELADCDLVIEAIIESEPEKLSLFQQLDKITQPGCVLASNTSSIPIIALASATTRSSQVLGMHFFNPAPVQPLVELVSCLETSDICLESVRRFSEDVLGKNVITTRDRAGFVVNRLLVPYLTSAIEMLDRGQASREDIDNGMRYGCAHPMGPLELCDLIGLDTVKAVADVLYAEFKEPLYAPPPLLSRMVAAGQLGRKSGRGFYSYDG